MTTRFTAGIQIRGLPELKAKMRKLGMDVDFVLAQELYREAEEIMGESKAHYVPVDTGVLAGTGHVKPPKIRRGSGAVVTMGYGGAAKAYAIVQHERLDYRHNVGQAKYLEVPTLLAARGMGGRIGERLRLRIAALAGAGGR
jgi:hypothetical protein